MARVTHTPVQMAASFILMTWSFLWNRPRSMASMKMIKTMKAAKNMNRDVIIGILVL